MLYIFFVYDEEKLHFCFSFDLLVSCTNMGHEDL